jgi:THO complex subunit 1
MKMSTLVEISSSSSSSSSLLPHAMDLKESVVKSDAARQKPLPTDSHFIDTLEEPLRSIGLSAIPPVEAPLPPATARAYTLELQLRSFLLNQLLMGRPLLRGGNSENRDDEDVDPLEPIVQYWQSSLGLCVHLVHFCQVGTDGRYENMSVRKLPLVLLEDVLDGLSISHAKTFWQLAVEPRLDSTIFSPLLWKQSNICHLPLLKVCNKFLRLLADSAEWSGRVMWALSRGFGVADKSAMKMWGSFHTDNVTEYESEQEFTTAATNAAVVVVAGEGPAGANATGKKGKHSKKDDGTAIDYSLYQAFWSLQSDFSNPNRIQVADFLKKLRIVLAALESAHKSNSSSNSGIKLSKTSGTKPAAGASSCIDNSSFSTMSATPKYLTSSSLLPLQLATTEFRVHLVTQFLIVGTHLSSESPPLAQTLSTLQQRAKKLLEVDAPEHLRVLESIILKRELHWRTWKKSQKCNPAAFAPRYKKDAAVLSSKGDEKKAKRPRLMDPLLSSTKQQEENPDFSFEFMDRAELARTSKRMTDKIPSLHVHLQPYVDALDPDAGIDDEYHPKNDRVYCWQAMRLFSRHHLDRLHLVNCSGGGDFERLCRHVYLDKGIEIPGEMPPPPENEFFVEEEKQEEKVVVKDIEDHNETNVEKNDSDLFDENDDTQEGGHMDNAVDGHADNTAMNPDAMEVEPTDGSLDEADVGHDGGSPGHGSVDDRGASEQGGNNDPQDGANDADDGEAGEESSGQVDVGGGDERLSQASTGKGDGGGPPVTDGHIPTKNSANQLQKQLHGRYEAQRGKGAHSQAAVGGGGAHSHGKRGPDNRGPRRSNDESQGRNDTQSRNSNYQDRAGTEGRGGNDGREEGRNGPRFTPRPGIGGTNPPARDEPHRGAGGGGGGSGGGGRGGGSGGGGRGGGNGGDRRGDRDDRDDRRWRGRRR